ncbi:hypothetical protein [Calidifontibacter terrae]
MSQIASARLPLRRAPRGANPTATRARLKLVQPAVAQQSGIGFVVLCVSLVVAGFLSVLLLNTARAQQQYTIDDLQSQTSRLAGTQQELSSEIDALSAPQQLALKAQEMGLAPASKVTYVRASDRRVVGVASGAAVGSAFTVDTLPTTPTSKLAGLAVSTAGQSVVIAAPKPTLAPVTQAESAPAVPSQAQQNTTNNATKNTQSKTSAKPTPAR